MKKVVLLGDSIRLVGYGPMVEEALKGEYEVWQPKDNCRFAAYTLRMLFAYRKELENAHIIHWNNGLWDATHCMGDGPFTPIETYVATMKRIAEHLLRITDKVIFSTTTAVAEDSLYDKNETIRRYNAAVVPELMKMGVQINDLFSVVAADQEKYICEDTLHLSKAGSEACAKKVLEAIRKADQ